MQAQAGEGRKGPGGGAEAVGQEGVEGGKELGGEATGAALVGHVPLPEAGGVGDVSGAGLPGEEMEDVAKRLMEDVEMEALRIRAGTSWCACLSESIEPTPLREDDPQETPT